MSTSFSTETIRQLAARLPVPQRLEIQTALRILYGVNLAGKACLDIGFGSPDGVRVLRMAGGTDVGLRNEADLPWPVRFCKSGAARRRGRCPLKTSSSTWSWWGTAA